MSLRDLLLESVEVPGGTFTMGARQGDADASTYEFPNHQVEVSRFRMAVTPVTNGQFATFVKDTGFITLAEKIRMERSGQKVTWKSYATDKDDHPVVCVSHFDALAYLDWLTATTEKPESYTAFQLPTEAEWEKAARGGFNQSLYPWGDEVPGKNQRMVWARSRSDQADNLGTMPVGKFEANGYGLLDMAGYVWEWCSDWYGEVYYSLCQATGIVVDPKGPEEGIYRVRRGASWNIGESFRARCSNRGCLYPEQMEENLGFRWVLR